MPKDPTFSYEMHDVVGRGGFGTVYRAELRGPSGFSKVVAVKLLNREAEGNVDLVQRLRDEARMLGLIQHRAIVQVDRLVVLDGRWAVVMEYVPGFDLRVILKQFGALPLGAALEVVEELASALHVAYSSAPGVGPEPTTPLGLIHRDVKPANVRITRSGAVKLLDFGIARAHFAKREADTSQLRFGSMNYMSPRRLAMQDDGHAGDVYALGAVLYEAVTSISLGMSSHHPSAHAEVVRGGLEVLRTLSMPEEFVQLVGDCLAYAPEDRPDARQLLARARQIRNGLGDAPSLLEWVDRSFPEVDAVSAKPDAVMGTVLYEAAPTRSNLTMTTDLFTPFDAAPDVAAQAVGDSPVRGFDPGAISAEGALGTLTAPTAMSAFVEEPVMRTGVSSGSLAMAMVGLAALILAVGMVIVQPEGFALTEVPPDPEPPTLAQGPVVELVGLGDSCQVHPIEPERDSIRSVDALFRGWQELDIERVGRVIAHDFERQVGDDLQDKASYIEQRKGMFERLETVTWTGTERDALGWGVPQVEDAVAVRCEATGHLRVVVRYDWSVRSKSGNEKQEQGVVDAYELDEDGFIVSNLDYADLQGARGWRNRCCEAPPPH
ncbi:MAG: serine/threonine protein kinase [Myxococcales bacterium]|nr:serine/threonine protein kinase [Myxococcales bacterium]